MKIRSLAIDGFGVFHDLAIDDLSDGLTIFHGPNEAGKSTLLAFLRGVLFGFPARRRRELQYEPLRGGRHGGRVTIDAPEGRYVVTRRAGRRHAANVVLPNGSEGGEAELSKLLGGADDHLFRSVFAFSLTELQTFESLSTEGVRERIFSAGVAGAGRSARDAMAELAERSATLWKPRGKSRARTLLERRRAIDTEMREAERRMSTHTELVALEKELAARVEALRSEEDATRAALNRLELLIDMWPTWNALSEVEAKLATLDSRLGPSDAAATRDLAGEFDALDRGVALLQSQLGEEIEFEALVERTSAAFEQQLLDLGPDWDATRLSSFDQSIPRREHVRDWQVRLERSATTITELTTEHERLVEQRAAIEYERQRIVTRTTGPEPPRLADIEHAEGTLRHLRASLAQLSDLENTLHADTTSIETRERLMRQLQAERPWVPSAWLVAALCTAGGAAFGWTVTQLNGGRSLPWPPFLGGLVASVAAYVIHQIRRHALTRESQRASELLQLRDQQREGVQDNSECERVIGEVSRSIADDAGQVGLAPLPGQLDIEEHRELLERTRLARREWDEALERRGELDERLSAQNERVAASDTDVSDARDADNALAAAWLTWKEEAGIPAQLSPQGVADFFDALRAARGTLEDQTLAHDRLSQTRRAIADWSARAHRSMSAAGLDANPGALGTTLIELFSSAKQEWIEREELQRRQHEFESRLTERIGHDATAVELREALGSGRIEAWRRDAEAHRSQLDALSNARDAALRNHQDAHSERAELEQSADLPALALERAAITTELTATLEEWRELELAAALIEETLGEFERTRQPAVLAAASELYADVTGGRYHRLVLDSESGDIVAIDHRGERKSTGSLSRGTAEQLYLCLRLGLASEFAQRSAELPMIMDDVLVNFDPGRARTMADVLARVASQQQIMIFTCHPTTRDCLREAAPSARVIELPSTDRALQLPVG